MHILTKALLLQRPRAVIDALATQFGDDEIEQAAQAALNAKARQNALLSRLMQGIYTSLMLLRASDDDRFLLRLGVLRDGCSPLAAMFATEDLREFRELSVLYSEDEIAAARADGVVMLHRLHNLICEVTRLSRGERKDLSNEDAMLLDLAAISYRELQMSQVMSGVIGHD